MQNLELNDEQIFEEAKAQALATGVNNKDAWDALVGDIISAYTDVGEMKDEQNLDEKITTIQARWEEIEAELNKMVE